MCENISKQPHEFNKSFHGHPVDFIFFVNSQYLKVLNELEIKMAKELDQEQKESQGKD